MTAVLIPTTSEQEWLEARRHGVTASEIPVVMGLSPWSSPYALYWQKLGVLPGQDETGDMALGKHMESYVASRFAEKHPEFALMGSGRELYAHPERPWQMATPDRTVCERQPMTELMRTQYGPLLAVLECKIDGGSDGWGEDGTDEIPVHYRAQVLWQMDALSVTTGYLAAFLWHRRQVRVYELTMDDRAEADLKLMREEAWLFLKRLYGRNPPDIDWRPATAAALKRLHPSVEDRDAMIPRKLAAQYRAACAAVKAAERRKSLAENLVRQRMGTARRAVENAAIAHFAVARRDVYDLPEKTITRKATTVDRLVAVSPADREKP